MTQLSSDAEALLKLLPPSGRITNPTGMKITGWEYDRLIAAKFELREAGVVEIKRGYGGPFGRVPTPATVESTQSTILAVEEKELYAPVADWISAEFLPDDYDHDRDLFEVSISAARRPSGAGTWEIPDILSVSLKKYLFVPQVLMEVTSFEVKPQGQAFNVYGVFEAISQSKSVHRAYYCFEWQDSGFADRADYQRILQEAEVHGVGLIRVHFTDEKKKSILPEVLLEARALAPDPSALNGLIDMFFDEDVKTRISRRTAHNIAW